MRAKKEILVGFVFLGCIKLARLPAIECPHAVPFAIAAQHVHYVSFSIHEFL